MSKRRAIGGVVGAVVGSLLVVGLAEASNVSAGLTGGGADADIPLWLFVITGGGVVAASSMLSMLVADRELLIELHAPNAAIQFPQVLRRGVDLVAGVLGLLALAAVLVVGPLGPANAQANLAVLLVFVVGRSGLTMAAYLLGNPWPALNPYRRLIAVIPDRLVGTRTLPERWGLWPAVVALLLLITLEILLPVTEQPSVLAALVAAYSAVTVAGAVVVGPTAWFDRADPVSTWFRMYGAVAPLQRTDDGWTLRVPGARLREADLFGDRSAVAFVIALVFELTYSGFVATPAGRTAIESVVAVVQWPPLAYLLVLVVGYAGFYWVYRRAAEKSRAYADTYVTASYLAYRFAPPLLGIAAGYHLAHYLGFGLSLAPSLLGALQAPLSPPLPPTVLETPGWFGLLDVGFLLVGHVVAIWYAHATSFDVFAGRLQAIRSQYPFVFVMVLYTMLSVWILSMDTVDPAFVGG